MERRHHTRGDKNVSAAWKYRETGDKTKMEQDLRRGIPEDRMTFPGK